MVQTFDFMSKHYQHVLIQKVTFSTKKRTLDTALHKKTMYQCTKPMYTPIKQCCIYTPISLSYSETFLCAHSVFHLQQPSLDWLNYLVYS